jgi:membrane-associated phospholipid phosphatase
MKRKMLTICALSALLFLAVAIPQAGIATNDANPDVYYVADRIVAKFGFTFGHPLRPFVFAVAKATAALFVSGTIACVVAAARRKRWDLVVFDIVCLLSAIPLVESLLKNWVNRTSYGHTMYPSGHTTFATIVALIGALTIWELHGTTALRRWRKWLIAFPVFEIVVLLVSKSHWFSDTIGGLATGVTWTLLCYLATQSIVGRRFPSALRGDVAVDIRVVRTGRGKHSLQGNEEQAFRKGSTLQDLVDRHGHARVTAGNGVPGVVRRESDVDPVVGVRPGWVMIEALGDECNTGHKSERLREVGERKRSM